MELQSDVRSDPNSLSGKHNAVIIPAGQKRFRVGNCFEFSCFVLVTHYANAKCGHVTKIFYA